MFTYERGEVNFWWNKRNQLEKFPGKSALFVGAGISVDVPTSLPQGNNLTTSLLHHLLDQRAAEEILSVFSQCQSILRRSLPRLEHVLDKACSSMNTEGFTRSGNPRELLNLFSEREPNGNHNLIAEHLLANKGWCITTNFDDCIERASSYRIPVHVMRPESKKVEVLYSEYGEDWGIVKLHGTIALGVEMLGATLADLEPGLPDPLRALLTMIMETVDAVIVAGYSGSDHFDVNHWIRQRSNYRRNSPKLIWIFHETENNSKNQYNDKSDAWDAWCLAFSGTKEFWGDTNELLSTLIGIPKRREGKSCHGVGTSNSLDCQLAQLYTPSAVEKHLNGARLAASIGLGQLAAEELIRAKVNLETNVTPDVLFALGMKKEALETHRNLDRIREHKGTITRTRLLRHQGHRLIAIGRFLYLSSIFTENRVDVDEAIEALACALDIIEDLQKFSLLRTKVLRRVASVVVSFLWKAAKFRKELPLSLQGKLETQRIRAMALFQDDDEARSLIGQLRLLITDQYSSPDFYADNGPLIPGYFLIEESTAREEDRLADLVEIKLQSARILLCALRRRWPDGIESVKKSRKNKEQYATSSERLVGEACATVIFNLLSDATRIATALSEHSLHVAIAECWLSADQQLGGVAYWKPQRLYLSR